MLMVNQLVGFGAGGETAAPAAIAYAASSSDETGSTTVTFTSLGIGTASSDRYVLVVVATRLTGSISSVTVGGAATTSVVAASNGVQKLEMYITSAVFTSGTTANVVVTTSAANSGVIVATYTITGIVSITPSNTQTTTTDNATMSLSVPAGGVAISGANDLGTAVGNTNGATFTHSGTTENADRCVGFVALGAGSLSSPGGTTASIAIDAATTSTYVAACASLV